MGGMALINEVAARCFLALAKTLSFTETAKLMFMTQQSVSKYIAKFEEDVGFKLFIRTHHYVMLTKAGEYFYELFAKFDEDFVKVTEKTKQYYTTMYNSIRIGYLEWLEISSEISAAVKNLKKENPELRFIGEMHPQFKLIELFMTRKLDLIITYAEFSPKGPGIKKMKVLETPLVLLVSPDNPKASRSSRPPPATRQTRRPGPGRGNSAASWASRRRRSSSPRISNRRTWPRNSVRASLSRRCSAG